MGILQLGGMSFAQACSELIKTKEGIKMYTITIFNHMGKPMVQLPSVYPLLANHWYGIAKDKGYDVKLEYIGGAEEEPNHKIASDQDLKLYS